MLEAQDNVQNETIIICHGLQREVAGWGKEVSGRRRIGRATFPDPITTHAKWRNWRISLLGLKANLWEDLDCDLRQACDT